MAESFLITGGQGFIGAWVVRALLGEGTPTVILDRSPDNSILSQVVDLDRLGAVERVFADITETETVARVVRDHGITHVIHLAGLQVPTCRSDPVLGARVNVLGTLNVFEAVRLCAGQVRMTVYASSAAVAGEIGEYSGPIDDSTRHEPKTHYGVYKAANEGNARVYHREHGLPSVGLRPYTVYGVGREVGITSGPTKAIKSAVLGRRFEIPFTGMTSFVYAEDLARIFVDAARSEIDDAVALNLRGAVDSVENFMELLAEAVPGAREMVTASGGPIPIAYEVREKGLEDLLGGTVPLTPLRDGIQATAEFFCGLARAGRLHDRDLA